MVPSNDYSANVITSLDQQSLQSAKSPLTAFFYCDFRRPETQDLLNILGSLVRQICSQLGLCSDELELAFNHSRYSHKRPTLALLKDLICYLLLFKYEKHHSSHRRCWWVYGSPRISQNNDLFHRVEERHQRLLDQSSGARYWRCFSIIQAYPLGTMSTRGRRWH